MKNIINDGPSYPYVNLEQALVLARKLYEYSKKTPASIDAIIVDAWKFSATSSRARSTATAMKHYGLVDELSGPQGKMFKLTSRALLLLLDDQNSIERREELKRAALAPEMYSFCWKTCGKDLPASLRSTLLLHHGFTETTAESFIKNYRKTIEYAGLLSSDVSSTVGEISNTSTERLVTGKDLRTESESGNLNTDVGGSLRPNSINQSKIFKLTPPTEKVSAQKESFRKPALLDMPFTDLTTSTKEVRQDIFSLPEGPVSIQLPYSISEESYRELLSWFELLGKKFRRSVVQSTAATPINNSIL